MGWSASRLTPTGQLELVPFYFSGSSGLIHVLAERLRSTFRCEVAIRRVWFDAEECFDASRGQYNSTKILGLLLPGATSLDAKLLGITSLDLFMPVLSYVFGEAQLDGIAAVVSSHRLDDAAYGLPPSESTLLARLEKEATHELGHTFGLIHCPDLDCAMHGSTYVEEIDLRGAAFCPSCAAKIRMAQR